MIELAKHIEALLLENDCVIIPGMGGFIAHYTSAERAENEGLFLPPTRTIGFHPQLKLNDGVLVQSYMGVYDINFPDANKMVAERVAKLSSILHKEGRAELPNIGEFRYTINGQYEFDAYDYKIATPYLYGLDAFEMQKLDSIRKPQRKYEAAPIRRESRKSYEININRAFLRGSVAAIAAIALFFILSTPLENTAVERSNYADLLPAHLFEKIESHSVAATPIIIRKDKKESGAKPMQSKEAIAPQATPVAPAVRETTIKSKTAVNSPPATVAATKQIEGGFHIIVAGGIGMKDAESMAEQLRKKGFAGAKALDYDGKIRVSIQSYPTQAEAMKQLLKLRENEIYQTAWMLAQ